LAGTQEPIAMIFNVTERTQQILEFVQRMVNVLVQIIANAMMVTLEEIVKFQFVLELLQRLLLFVEDVLAEDVFLKMFVIVPNPHYILMSFLEMIAD
jgi:hypothetical protein